MLFLGTYSRGHCLAKLKTGLLLTIIDKDNEIESLIYKKEQKKPSEQGDNEMTFLVLFSP